MKTYVVSYSSSDNTSVIRLIKFTPEDETTIKGLIQFVHGSTEHILRFKKVAEYFTSLGYVLFGHDIIGHGESVPSGYTYINGRETKRVTYEQLINDAIKCADIVVPQYDNLPLHLIGFSLGSHIAKALLIKKKHKYSTAILLGTSHSNKSKLNMGLKLTEFATKNQSDFSESELLNKVVFGNFPNTLLKGEDDIDWLFVSRGYKSEYTRDNLVRKFHAPGVIRESLKLMKYVADKENLKLIDSDVQVLICSGTNDITSNSTELSNLEHDLKKAGVEHVELKWVKGFKHCLLHDVCRNDVLKLIYNFMNN